MSAEQTEDPIRADVERRLHAAVGTILAAPFVVVGTFQRCVESRAVEVVTRLRQPWDLVRSMFDLVAQPTTGPVDPSREVPVVSVAVAPDPDSPVAADLPIDEYESLAASQVVARLVSLTPSELTDVERFERAHRGRRTVLGKIEQLLATP